MFDLTTYTIRRIRKAAHTGITSNLDCTLDAVIKFDSPESMDNVYNEIVALRLAQTLHIPVATGVLVSQYDGPAYASIQLSLPAFPLPNLLVSNQGNCAEKYPDEAAAIVAFDIWIGNFDRESNIKASIFSDSLPFFCAFDHSHCLLNVEKTRTGSIRKLKKGEFIVMSHPFYGYTDPYRLQKWIRRIASLEDHMIDECVRFKKCFRQVSTRIQAGLSNALKKRRDQLSTIVKQNKSIVFDNYSI